jgi:hypothetical protein
MEKTELRQEYCRISNQLIIHIDFTEFYVYQENIE